MFHRHRWELIDKTILPSAWEQTAKSLEKFKSNEGTFSDWFFRVKIVLTFKCSVCQKLKVVTEQNP